MRQNEEPNALQTLATNLKTLHPADFITGAQICTAFIDSELENCNVRDGIDRLNAAISHNPSPAPFSTTLKRYERLLQLMHDYCFAVTEELAGDDDAERQGAKAVISELERIADILGVNLYESSFSSEVDVPQAAQQTFLRRVNWKDALACAVAVGGGVLLELMCSGQDPWRHFVGLLALLLVAVPVWKLAKRSAQRSAPALTAQPTR